MGFVGILEIDSIKQIGSIDFSLRVSYQPLVVPQPERCSVHFIMSALLLECWFSHNPHDICSLRFFGSPELGGIPYRGGDPPNDRVHKI